MEMGTADLSENKVLPKSSVASSLISVKSDIHQKSYECNLIPFVTRTHIEKAHVHLSFHTYVETAVQGIADHCSEYL